MKTSLKKFLRKKWCGRNLKENKLIFGKYRLIRKLGEGGYFKVWLAHHNTLDRDVVMRFLYGLSHNDKKRSYHDRRNGYYITKGL